MSEKQQKGYHVLSCNKIHFLPFDCSFNKLTRYKVNSGE
jgi:hypothetical protein